MKVLNLSLDNSILDKNSSSAKRIIEYGNLVEKYVVIVPNRKNKKVDLSKKSLAIGVGYFIKIFALFKIYKIAKRILSEKKYNIITVQDQYYLALIGFILSKKFKIELEIQIHGFEKYYGLRKIIAKFILPRANLIRVVSKRLKKYMINEFKVNESKITVIPIFVNIKNNEQINLHINNAENQDNKFIFLTVGRLVPVKNIKIQINAMKRVAKQNKEKIELWVIGKGLERKKLETESKKLDLKNNIKFWGWQNNLAKFYKQADTFLLTSNYEGWGRVIIEAASYGLPIIMTDVGCAGEVIINNKSGLVIPTNNQKKLEEAMIKLINNIELRKKLGKNALKAVQNLQSKEEILRLYKKSWEIAIQKTKSL